jgi:hypothetical protein
MKNKTVALDYTIAQEGPFTCMELNIHSGPNAKNTAHGGALMVLYVPPVTLESCSTIEDIKDLIKQIRGIQTKGVPMVLALGACNPAIDQENTIDEKTRGRFERLASYFNMKGFDAHTESNKIWHAGAMACIDPRSVAPTRRRHQPHNLDNEQDQAEARRCQLIHACKRDIQKLIDYKSGFHFFMSAYKPKQAALRSLLHRIDLAIILGENIMIGRIITEWREARLKRVARHPAAAKSGGNWEFSNEAVISFRRNRFYQNETYAGALDSNKPQTDTHIAINNLFEKYQSVNLSPNAVLEAPKRALSKRQILVQD